MQRLFHKINEDTSKHRLAHVHFVSEAIAISVLQSFDFLHIVYTLAFGFSFYHYVNFLLHVTFFVNFGFCTFKYFPKQMTVHHNQK